MKRWMLWLLLLTCLLPCAGHAEPSEASAAEKIAFYHQSTGKDMLAAYPYNAVECRSASFTVLGGNGCSIFAGLHAYQWLYGKFETVEEQTLRAQEMVALLEGKNPAVKGNGPSVAFRYARNMGAYKEENLQKTRTSISRFFDEKEGVLYLHATWPGGGHYFVAVGYTWHEINGEDTFLLHVVDSGAAGTVKQFRAYDFATFERAVPQAYELPAQEYWMPLQSGVDIFYGVWRSKEEAGQ